MTIPPEFYNSLEYPSDWRYKPNGDMRRCQCVMKHTRMAEGSIPQCSMPRNPGSDLYCSGCEAVHGKAWNDYQAELEQRKKK